MNVIRTISIAVALLLLCLPSMGQPMLQRTQWHPVLTGQSRQPDIQGQSKWEQELATAMDSDSTAATSDLKLTGYGDIRTLVDITDCEKVLDEIMRKEEICVNPEEEEVEFSIMFLCRRRKDVTNTEETIRLEDIVKPGMKAVTLWWGFRGEK